MSTPRSRDRLIVLALVACLTPALAASDPSQAQRDRIGRERLGIERATQQAQEACALEFAVTDCVNRAKARRRERIRPLDLELARLDDALRKQRAAQRLAQTQQRQSAQREAPTQVAVRTPRAASEPQASALPVAAAVRSRAADGAAAEAEAAHRAAAAARRADQATAHRTAVEERNRKWAAQRPPAKSLPLPPVLAASR